VISTAGAAVRMTRILPPGCVRRMVVGAGSTHRRFRRMARNTRQSAGMLAQVGPWRSQSEGTTSRFLQEHSRMARRRGLSVDGITVCAVTVDFTFYSEPNGKRLSLPVRPELASWDQRGSPSQAALAAYLDQARHEVAAEFNRIIGPVCLRLDVGLPHTVSLLDQHDLDNYLFPLMVALDQPEQRIVSVWGSKRHTDKSFITVAPALVATERHDWNVSKTLVTHASAASTAFKEQIHRQLDGIQELPAGGVRVEIGFVVGPGRYWPNLWKPTIDSLDPILGRTRPERPWHPRDGRIVRLGLHRAVDPALANNVRITVRAASTRS
jgi:hypothetical protein